MKVLQAKLIAHSLCPAIAERTEERENDSTGDNWFEEAESIKLW
jgi:hypothetical protein